FMSVQRAFLGTQNIFSAKYSSLSSGSAHSSSDNVACNSSNESETYFKNNNPSTTCLYSDASILPRNLSAMPHNFSSKPIFAVDIIILLSIKLNIGTINHSITSIFYLPQETNKIQYSHINYKKIIYKLTLNLNNYL